MVKILNGLLNVLKMFLLLVCFVLTFYIIFNMYKRLDKNMAGMIFNFIPFLLLFILFSINFIFKQESVNQNVFFNISCLVAFLALGFVLFRTLTDKNMIVLIRMGYDINFNYFADFIAPMRIFLYSLAASDALLMISGIKGKKEVIKEEIKEEKPKVNKEVKKTKKSTKKS